jgi:hypothetical protein
MRRALIALYVAIMVIVPLPWIGTPDTGGGSLLIAAIAVVALILGVAAVTGRVPFYGPEVAILAVVPFGIVLLGEGAYPMLWFIPVLVVLGEQLASKAERRRDSAGADGAADTDADDGDDDDS